MKCWDSMLWGFSYMCYLFIEMYIDVYIDKQLKVRETLRRPRSINNMICSTSAIKGMDRSGYFASEKRLVYCVKVNLLIITC